MDIGSRTFGFGLRAFKKFPELLPLVGIIGTACTGACAFMWYALATKPDVRMVRSRGPAYQDVKPLESRKIFNLFPEKFHSNPEIEKLRKELGSYKS